MLLVRVKEFVWLLYILAFFKNFPRNNTHKPLVSLIHGFGEIINKKKLF